jgi:hypothetical protein
MAKNVEIGSLIVSEDNNGNKRVSIGLGKKNRDAKYSKYDLSVEVVVRDHTGKVIAKQTDGFINLIDPRTRADDLLKAGIIDEDKAADMRMQATKIPDKIKYQLQVPRIG